MDNQAKKRKPLTLLLTAVMGITLVFGATACGDNNDNNGVDGGSVDAGGSTPSATTPADPSVSPSASPSASASASQ
ncbi:hypothetical protein [Cohnella kolymensis]|nr:hypothetical protein [Cohnella kolymensis]